MEIFDFSKPKNIKKVKAAKKVLAKAPGVNKQQQNKEYYDWALERITQLLMEHNLPLATPTRKLLERPQIWLLGPKRILWRNFVPFCNEINREVQHVSQYFFLELGTEGSIAGESLIIRKKFTSTKIETLIKQYLKEYVLCSMCRSLATSIMKDVESRLYIQECKICMATKTVPKLKISNMEQI
ncbi:unnamed protein product (macronuclear) [Paramecium tetraurelia]|uniref:Translation initiation factor IF2/IF5 domain-containing protein n=1 Tax=Paramecium tetraurelia TaxID=5888 RepID=A0CJ44_PARTE|nr:uncharacterized protein GSPATT00038593001 [Paramecium tetraurelia]CAK70811.1 unnamed protein product [Paramecium tetraurelia]|eukprot:XP_001438208.1 hypothetical protein (macronuclear) [Paramecium tetraurelia strain d4-2]